MRLLTTKYLLVSFPPGALSVFILFITEPNMWQQLFFFVIRLFLNAFPYLMRVVCGDNVCVNDVINVTLVFHQVT